MHVCPQTLVLVDNDATVSEVNQKLVKATLKYMFYHMPEDRTFCLNTYDHDLSGAEEYQREVNDLVCSADNLEFSPKDSNLSDTLAQVITRWKDADFACRDILVFTDGLEGGATDHEKEELFYLVENSEYPVYIVFLDQEDNKDAKKGMSAIAVTSGGKLFETELSDREAAIDRHITESVFAAMNEYSQVHWAKYEEENVENIEDKTTGDAAVEETAGENEEAAEESTKIVSEDVAGDEYLGTVPVEEKVVYEYEQNPGFFGGTGALILSAALIAAGLVAGIGGGFVIMKKKRAGRRAVPAPPVVEEDFFDDYELKGISTTDLAEADEGDTTYLSDMEGFSGATRLLNTGGRTVMLSDIENTGRAYRIVISSPMSIGRANCDVLITGDDALSKRHCELSERDGDVVVTDLSSSNGTRVNGVRVTGSVLNDGDELSIGSRSYKVALL